MNLVRNASGITLALGVLAITLTGCSGQSGEATIQSTKLRFIAVQYGQYIAQNQGTPPPDEAKFKAFINANRNLPQLLSNAKVTTLDEMFVSPRDNQPFVIVYNAKISASIGPAPKTVIAYEQTGKDGKRLVAYGNTEVEEVDETKFNELKPKTS